MRIFSSSSVKPAYSLKQALEVTLRAILKPEVSESRETEETPVIKVLAMVFLQNFLLQNKRF